MILLALGADRATAADFEIMQNNAEPGVPILYVSGIIERGDTDKLTQYLRSDLDRAPLINDVWLNSPGGNLAEAMRLGALMERLGHTAVVPTGARCASACFFVWIGASGRFARGDLVIHRPYFDMDESSSSASGYEQAYREASESAHSYLRQRNVPSYLIELMMKVSSVEAYTLSDRDKSSIGHMSNARVEYMIQSCGMPDSKQAEKIQRQGGPSQSELKILRECGLRFYQRQRFEFFFGDAQDGPG
jgi:hypothetical protein